MPHHRDRQDVLHRRKNNDYNWNYDPQTYIEGNYQTLIPEDRLLGKGAVNAFRILTGNVMPKYKRGLHIGIGAVPRGSALIAPLMDSPENGAEILMGDIGDKKLQATRELMVALKLRKLGLWQAHEDDMATIDERWAGSMQKAAMLGRVETLNMFNLPRSAFDIVTAEHLYESATKDRNEYDEARDIFYNSAERGGIVHRAYVYGSEGYSIGDQEFPALTIWPDNEVDQAEKYLTDVRSYVAPASGEMRESTDGHSYGGLAVLVGRKR